MCDPEGEVMFQAIIWKLGDGSMKDIMGNSIKRDETGVEGNF
jgi:hypothetical protein